MHHRPLHPEHLFVRPRGPRTRTTEVAIQIPTHRGISQDASSPAFVGDIPRNRLLGALPRIEQELLASSLERTMIVAGQKLAMPNTAPTHLYFPETAVV